MKVIAFNGSPKPQGNTHEALKLVLGELEAQGIDTQLVHIGAQPLRECTACGMCARNRDERCVLPGDDVNLWIQQMKTADGILFGSPTHFSGMSSLMKAFLDRAFYVAGNNGGLFRHKVAASVTAVRRSGGIGAIDAMNKYILYSEMMMPASVYWNIIHGAKPGEADEDTEGSQIMRVLGQNMAWLIKVMEEGKKLHPAPPREKKQWMNFIR